VISHQNRCCQQQYQLAIAPCSNFSPQEQQAVLLQLPEIFGDRLESVLNVSPIADNASDSNPYFDSTSLVKHAARE